MSNIASELITRPYVYQRPYSTPIACTDKRRYAVRERAQGIVRTMQRRGHDREGRLHAYQCDHCHAWHVGNRPVYRFTGRLRVEGVAKYHETAHIETAGPRYRNQKEKETA